MQTQLINFTIPKKLLKKVDVLAKKELRSRSELLREAVRRYFEEQNQRERDFEVIRKTARRINLPEDKAMTLVGKVRDALPMNQ